MLVSQLVHAESVCANLKSDSKENVLAEMVEYLQLNKKISNKEEVLRALLNREKDGSTGIGNSVAVPHARLESVKEPILFVGLSQKGVEFAALDGAPVKVFVLLLTPSSEITLSLKILANISRMISDKYFTTQLMAIINDQDLFNLLKQSVHNTNKAFHSINV